MKIIIVICLNENNYMNCLLVQPFGEGRDPRPVTNLPRPPPACFCPLMPIDRIEGATILPLLLTCRKFNKQVSDEVVAIFLYT